MQTSSISNMFVFNNKTIESFHDSILEIVDPVSSQKIYQAVVDQCCKFLDANYGSIFIYKGDKLIRVYSTIPSTHKIEPRKLGYTYKAYKNQKIYILSEDEIRVIHPDMLKTGTKSLIIIPLSYKKHSFGVLTLRSNKAFYFDKEKVEMLKLFASVAALKVRNSYLRNEMKKQLRFREEFAALASHELKTPLTIISLYNQLLEDRINSKKQIKDEWFRTIQKQVDKMTNIINEFLKVKQIKSRSLKYQFEFLNIYSLLKQVIKNYSVTNPENVIKFDFLYEDINKLNIRGDKNKLEEVFTNIINNAIKFSSATSIILIKLRLEDDSILLEFIDEGNGILSKDLPYVFEPFFRGGKLKKSGSGLGLFLSKNIINDHKGTIEIISKVKKGTRVVIKLPVCQISKAATEESLKHPLVPQREKFYTA